MSSIHHDTGFSEPIGLDDLLLDSGFGDPPVPDGWLTLDGYSSRGFGDPLSSIDYSAPLYVELIQDYLDIPGLKSKNRVSYPDEISQEGGLLLRLQSTILPFDEGDHRIDFIDAGMAIWPQIQPGCNSAIFGKGSNCVREPSRYAIYFASPACPIGTYQVRVTRPDSSTEFASNTIEVVYTPRSRNVDWLVELPEAVYSPRIPTGPAPDIQLPRTANFIGGILYAMGKELQLLHGVPEAHLIAPLATTDTTAYLSSTFGFPDDGFVLIDGVEEQYTNRTINSIDLLTQNRWRNIAVFSRVQLVSFAIRPDRYVRGQ